MDTHADTRLKPLMLNATVLGSGSSGNALAVCFGHDTVLLDCGFSARETERRLTAASIDPSSVRAIFVSHEHVDHVRGVRVFASRISAPVYTSRGTRDATGLEREVPEVRVMGSGDTVTVASMTITAFRTSHDASQPLGFRFETPSGIALGVLTDTGIVTSEAREALRGCTMLAIESNHDSEMLEHGPYPWFLKRRISSTQGHLSNVAAAELVSELASDSLTSVTGIHLSTTNNTSRLASAMLTGALARLGHPAQVHTAAQDQPCPLVP